MASEDTAGSQLQIVSEDFADCRVVSVSGSIDHTNSDRFLAELSGLAEGVTGQGGLVADLSGLEFITSAGLRALLLADGAVKRAGGRLVVTGIAGTVQEVFRISMFDSLLATAASVEEAVATISPAARRAYSG